MNSKKNVEKIKTLLLKNQNDIEHIFCSDSFFQTIMKYPEFNMLEVVENEEFGEFLLLCGIPLIESKSIQKNAVMETKAGELIILALENEGNKTN